MSAVCRSAAQATTATAISVVITDSASHTITATTTVSGGTWSVGSINASGFTEGTVTYAVTETDAASNTTTVTQTVSKDTANITETANVVTYTAGPGINNNVSVTISGSNFVFNDTAEAMFTNISGATGNGTNTVDVPTSGVTGITLNLADGTDAISSTGVVLTTQTLTISHSGTGLTITGPLTTTTGAISVTNTGTGAITDNGVITTTSGAVTISSANALAVNANVGNSSTTGTISLSANSAGSGSGGLTITGALATASGAISIMNTGLGAITANGAISTASGNITISTTGGAITDNGAITTTSGPISISTTGGGAITDNAAITTTSGNVSMSSTSGLALNANLTAGSGTITISADTAGSGTAGFTQGTAAALTTTNATANAISITVNTASGGTGNAVLGTATDSTTTAGTYNVQVYGGSISTNGAYTGGETGTTAPANIITAFAFVFNANGATSGIGSVGAGTVLIPDNAIVIAGTGTSADGPISATTTSPLSVTAGSGGIYVYEMTAHALMVSQAEASGSGNIFIEATNASGHQLFVDGPVATGSGSIVLGADDDLYVGTGNDNVVIGGTDLSGETFSGTVTLFANMDHGNGQVFVMNSGSLVTTTNTSANAVLIQPYSSAGSTGSASVIPCGGAVLGNITTGSGGTITVNAGGTAATDTSSSRLGSIAQQPGTSLNVGTGTVILTALCGDTTTVAGNIGTSTTPISVTAANISVSTTGNAATAGVTGTIYVTATGVANFTATTSGVSGSVANDGAVQLTTTSGVLTINGATSSVGDATASVGTITLNGAAGVALAAPLGNATTAAISINGPLSGNGNIVEGTGAVTITQDANSSYSGAITGNQSVTKAGLGTLTLSNTSTYSGGTTISAGALLVNGSIGNVTIGSGATLGGNGTVGAITDNSGTVSPSILSVSGTSANVVFSWILPYPTYFVTMNGTAAGNYSQLNVQGTGTVTGTVMLAGSVGYVPTYGDSLTIIQTAASGGITATFLDSNSNTLNNGSTFNLGLTGFLFTINGIGTNAVTLTEVGCLTTTTVASSNNPSVLGQSVTYTATVADSGSGAPTGTITFLDGTSVLGTALLAPSSNGVATITETYTTAIGVHTIGAVYGGDINYISSTATALTQTIVQAATTTTVSALPNTSTLGQSVTFTATVNPTSPAPACQPARLPSSTV